VSFSDEAGTSAEQMGADMVAFGTVCSGGSKICDYSPNPGAAGGPTSLAAAFAGTDASGNWTLCLGDSIWTTGGSLQSWSLTITTSGGSAVRASPSGMGLPLKDGAYDGTTGSMVCHTLTF
jgi:hypothetical protein